MNQTLEKEAQESERTKQFPHWTRTELIEWLEGCIERFSKIKICDVELDPDNIQIEEEIENKTNELKEQIIYNGSMLRAYTACLGYVKNLKSLD